jgi:hypothetical protein
MLQSGTPEKTTSDERLDSEKPSPDAPKKILPHIPFVSRNAQVDTRGERRRSRMTKYASRDQIST